MTIVCMSIVFSSYSQHGFRDRKHPFDTEFLKSVNFLSNEVGITNIENAELFVST